MLLFKKSILIILVVSMYLPLRSQIKGKVVDGKGNPLSFITVFDSSYQHHTISNIDGEYVLNLPQGTHKIYYQYLGYKTEMRSITFQNQSLTIDIVLEKESYSLPEVTITDDGEDPAYGIIRKSIKNRSINRYPVESYKAQVYGKGMVKLVDSPSKIFGQEVGNMGGMIDSSKQGIIYLSESVTEVSYSKPDYYYEKILASKVSGDPGGISINSFSRSNFSLYDETTDFSRNMISPIADNALSFYNFKLISTFIDESGYKIYKINFFPKSEYGPTYQGELNIVDGSFNFHSFDIFTKGNQLKTPMIDTLRLVQLFKPIEKDKWCIITQNIDFKVKFFGFKAQGYFNYIFIDYDLAFVQEKKSAEILSVDKTANKKDSIYWTDIRPIPLTDVEVKDYQKKDSLNLVWNSKAYKDSTDRANNKFKFNSLTFGYRYRNSNKNYSFFINSPANTIQFNAIEGTTLQLPISFTKRDTNQDTKYTIESFLQYGFNDERLKYGIRTSFFLNKNQLSKLTFTFSDRYEQFDESRPVGNFSNTFNSLIYKENYGRYFDQKLLKAAFQTELINGLFTTMAIAWDERKSLENTTNFSYRNKDLQYKPNNIRSKEGYSLNDRSFTIDLGIRIRIGQKYMSLPDDRVRLPSKWPTIQFHIKSALPFDESYVSYTKADISIYKNYMPMRRYGFGKINLKAGMFLNSDKISDVDLMHIQSNDLWFMSWSANMSYFRNVPFYTLSTNQAYTSIFYEHNFEGFITDKIPLIRRTNLQLTANIATHLRKDVQYAEVGLGIDGLSIGPLKVLKLDYVYSLGFKTDDMAFGRFRIVLNDMFNFEPGF
jgi:hypothetical protein